MHPIQSGIRDWGDVFLAAIRGENHAPFSQHHSPQGRRLDALVVAVSGVGAAVAVALDDIWQADKHLGQTDVAHSAVAPRMDSTD